MVNETDISLEEQASAVERAFINQRGFVNHLADLVAAKRRSGEELEVQESWTPGLEAGAKTMRWLVDNEALFKAFLAGRCDK